MTLKELESVFTISFCSIVTLMLLVKYFFVPFVKYRRESRREFKSDIQSLQRSKLWLTDDVNDLKEEIKSLTSYCNNQAIEIGQLSQRIIALELVSNAGKAHTSDETNGLISQLLNLAKEVIADSTTNKDAQQ